ncbi:DUF4864 domain-containing protein [Pedosphaera parvula]|uniref:DUF4864 domain-containing protein n=1 Tax=Pedosphaera parvula (strain Ellin514) TaxID=320771 RepID=B9XD68_PEDPL|nr:DUF4864 domain-containing protein [Pedosphaera parvula]EEF62014.1 hypothetical protein Cflav_PD6289 [Pedosphaera parvula Ellin514]
MNARLSLDRWVKTLTLGCIVGLLYYFCIAAWRTPPGGHSFRSHYTDRVSFHHPVPALRLSTQQARMELAKVVESQLTAFRMEDYPRAYTYAGSRFQNECPLPVFEAMVKKSYPVIASSRAAQYGVILDNGEEGVVNVGILDSTGRIHHYQYFLKWERTAWKINGVKEARFEGTII